LILNPFLFFRLSANCFSEYNIKLLEQSIISYLKPNINDINTAVSYTFGSIDINTYNPSNWDKSHPISVYDTKGNLFNEYSSINKAKLALGLSEYEIRWHRNRENHFVFVSKYGLDLRIVDETLATISSSKTLSSFQKLVPISGINLEEIPMGVVSIYLDDKETLHGVYESASKFAIDHCLRASPPWQTSRNINKEKAIPIANGLFSVYICCNPLYRQKILDSQDKKNWKVVSIDTLCNNIVRFHDNPNAARIELSALLEIKDLKPFRNFTKDYITGPTRKGVRAEPVKFRRRFKLMWLKDYIAE
jgi:hypothetical protein